MQQTSTANRIHIVDALRGFAAAYVALFHFTRGNPEFLSGGRLYSLGHYGWAGVDVFFVISGFIIPYSMYRAGYRVENFLRFVARRVIRLDPPYLVSVLLVIALNYLSTRAPGYMGPDFTVSIPRLLLHVGYLPGFFGVPWYGVVYWTLALELQFYLLIGLLFPLLVHPSKWVRDVVLAALALSVLLSTNEVYILMWLCPFCLGIAVFRYRVQHVSLAAFICQAALISAGVWYRLGIPALVVSLIATGLIAFVSIRPYPLLEFLGAISYSLYLVHVPVGGRVINLAVRLNPGPWASLAAVGLAFAASITVGYLLRRFVELPALRWSHRISWRTDSKPGELESVLAAP